MTARDYPVIDLTATGRNIAGLRRSRGLSVADLQEFFGFEAPQAIYKWQRGQCLPSTDNLYALAFLLGVPIEDILIPKRPEREKMPQDPTSCGIARFGAPAALTRLFHSAFPARPGAPAAAFRRSR